MKSYSAVVAIAGFASSVAAHGFISSPTPRMPGKGLSAACGEQVFNQQSSDRYGNVQGAQQNMQGDHPDCKIWQCKGVPFSDAGEIFSYTAGQVIPMKVEIRAPHDGVANVSIVSTSTDKIIGKPLISWDKYALTSTPVSAHPEWTSFDITMPDVSSECAKAGDCVIQWYWDAPSINQTYESCIDFSMGGGSGGNSTQPTEPTKPTEPSASAAPVSSAAPTPATPTSAAPTPSATPVEEAATPTPTAGSGSDSGSALPKEFTIKEFVSWLEANAGSSVAQKLRRAIAARTSRTHPRAFRI